MIFISAMATLTIPLVLSYILLLCPDLTTGYTLHTLRLSGKVDCLLAGWLAAGYRLVGLKNTTHGYLGICTCTSAINFDQTYHCHQLQLNVFLHERLIVIGIRGNIFFINIWMTKL